MAALGLVGGLAACGYREEAPSGTGATWTYTDDRGRVLDGPRPTRIVAQVTAAAALWEFGVRPVGIFGPATLPDGRPTSQAGAVDVASVTSLGNVWGEFDFDAYVGLRPELLVSVVYQNDELWYVPAEQVDQVERAAPTVGVNLAGVPMLDAIGEFADLAAALGADVQTPAVTDAKAAFERADQEFAAVVRERLSGQRVLVTSATQDHLYVGEPNAFPSVKHLMQRGMPLVVPEQTTDSGYWEALSWENAGKYPVDVILLDSREGNLQADDLAAFPTWARLPAVRAGRVISWNMELPFSYRALATELTHLTDHLRT
ncbi:iron complex transport system substrate-binding protein [Amycolatopsis arida]|uniref:Iron complex transport system substrate-binding protein n=2 Tax=Amycolatopsis arida TaxID=587909 RepID=A0A1I5TGJ9_9PSEU|nr:iron complex transport system substrate-binding protein [Amycolatopsis arida]SFP82048.1 iron complex transport system substrate-binding protein [Amycolatopsis arida]